ncbi:hypothetical protein ACJX0J_029563 [Zea mays]
MFTLLHYIRYVQTHFVQANGISFHFIFSCRDEHLRGGGGGGADNNEKGQDRLWLFFVWSGRFMLDVIDRETFFKKYIEFTESSKINAHPSSKKIQILIPFSIFVTKHKTLNYQEIKYEFILR